MGEEKVTEAELSERAGEIASRAGKIFKAYNPTVSDLPPAQDLPERFQENYSEIRRGFEASERGGVPAERVQYEVGDEQEAEKEAEMVRGEGENALGGVPAEDGGRDEEGRDVPDRTAERTDADRERDEPDNEAADEEGVQQEPGISDGGRDRTAEVHPVARGGERRGGRQRDYGSIGDVDGRHAEAEGRIDRVSGNYRITPDDRLGLGGQKKLFQDNSNNIVKENLNDSELYIWKK